MIISKYTCVPYIFFKKYVKDYVFYKNIAYNSFHTLSFKMYTLHILCKDYRALVRSQAKVIRYTMGSQVNVARDMRKIIGEDWWSFVEVSGPCC